MEKNKITVLGVGNILLQDEGFGVRVVEEVTRRFSFPSNVQVLDGGTLGMELMRFLPGTEKLILVDAIAGKKEAGSLYEFHNEEVKAYFKEKVSMHELGIQDVLAVLEVLEQPIKDMAIIGVQPKSLEIGIELSDTVAPMLEVVVNKVIEQLRSWQVEVIANG